MLDFTGKNVVIVGASSGIGEETAVVLAGQGANVILLARRVDRLQSICDSLNTDRKAYYYCDVTDMDSIGELIKKVVSEQGKIDGLVYVSGTAEGDSPLKLLSYDKHLGLFNTNYFGFIEVVRQVTKRTNYNEGLRIAAVSSVASMRGEKAHTAYSASKAAMDSAVRCIAKELASRGICINSVAPSMVNTQMYQRFVEVMGEESEANKNAISRQYLGLATTRDVANALTFLISNEARFITGITLPVDGGFVST